MGLAGIQPATSPSINLNIAVKVGYVIDLTEDPPPMLPRSWSRTLHSAGYKSRLVPVVSREKCK